MNLQSLATKVPVLGEVEVTTTNFITDNDQYITFMLGVEVYAIDILAIKEIRGWERPTIIPNSPDYVKGVINIRGSIIPIIDLRMAFGVGEQEYHATTVVVILSDKDKKIECTKGFVVDAVSDVIDADKDAIKKAPEFGGTIDSDFVRGLINIDNSIVTVLSVQELLRIEHDGEEE